MSMGAEISRRLVVTPAPDHRETAIGYSLRLTQANGYTTPNYFMRHYGTVLSKRGPTAQQLMDITGVDAASARRLQLVRQPKFYDFFGHALRAVQLRLEHHAICPDCTAENGILDASWHLKDIDYCPIHCVPLVDECDSCHSSLKLYRPGVGICRCTATVRVAEAVPRCTADGARLLQYLRARLIAAPDALPADQGFPLLDRIELTHCLDLVTLLRKRAYRFPEEVDAVGEVAQLDRAAKAVMAWSDGVAAFWAALDAQPVEEFKNVGQDDFEWLLSRKSKVGSRPAFQFLRQAVIVAIQTEHRMRPPVEVMVPQPAFDHFPISRPNKQTLLLRTEKGKPRKPLAWEAEWVQVHAAAEMTGCNVGQLLAAADQKLLVDEYRGPHGITLRKREVFKLKPSEDPGMNLAAAAQTLRVSPWFLARLRKLEEFSLEYVPNWGGLHSAEDLEKIACFFRRAHGHVICQRPYLTLEIFRSYSDEKQRAMTPAFLAAMKDTSAWVPVAEEGQ